MAVPVVLRPQPPALCAVPAPWGHPRGPAGEVALEAALGAGAVLPQQPWHSEPHAGRPVPQPGCQLSVQEREMAQRWSTAQAPAPRCQQPGSPPVPTTPPGTRGNAPRAGRQRLAVTVLGLGLDSMVLKGSPNLPDCEEPRTSSPAARAAHPQHPWLAVRAGNRVTLGTVPGMPGPLQQAPALCTFDWCLRSLSATKPSRRERRHAQGAQGAHPHHAAAVTPV